MSKHTPGPWTARTKTTRFAVTSQHLTVAHVIGLDAAAKADARLIAAAPDLLEALKDAREHIHIDRESLRESCTFPDGNIERGDQALLDLIDKKLARIDSAIAKAEGK